MSTRLQIADEVLFQTVADEAVLLNIADNHYYGLDDVATRMWQLLMEHGDGEAVIRAMLAEYDVEEATLRQDFAALVAEMEQRGLITRIAP
ncbi:PqqD family protein [Candidatus Chloroploca sp. Khr17]|uniref:PqqD family protein n=1 Tax=Candidatus Chloroploca sp. Khr17 TaxID=2496869 RepID=UPI00101DDBDC|nr:PqqD family protein [Candidatus Chloroploca sp. Khr17]